MNELKKLQAFGLWLWEDWLECEDAVERFAEIIKRYKAAKSEGREDEIYFMLGEVMRRRAEPFVEAWERVAEKEDDHE